MNRILFAAALLVAASARAGEPVRLANNPSLSPDGSQVAFDWNGDVWIAPTAGGVARPLTQNPSHDRMPRYSPDGKSIAFVSDRDNGPQAYVVSAEGGVPKQLTFNTEGCTIADWTADGSKLLVHANRDHGWGRGYGRFFTVSATGRSGEELLFDDYGNAGALSPDGKQLLFVREGAQWWRKGYHGSQAAQIWLYDLGAKSFRKVIGDEPYGALWPQWKADGKGFFYCNGRGGSFNLWEFDLASGENKQLTKFDESVVYPTVSRDGSTVVFRVLFDLYRYKPASNEPPQKIAIEHAADRPTDRKDRRTLASATGVAFSGDGLEVAFIAGGDLWVMDTELREPKPITKTSEEERSPVFSPEGDSIYFLSDAGGKTDVWRATRGDKNKYWFQNNKFNLERVTTDGATKSNLTWSPDGSKLAFLKDRGALWVMDPRGQNAKQVVKSFSPIEYDWSPDGKWFVASYEDTEYNRDIYVLPVDGSKPPVNVSRTPFNEHNPVWSPDGKLIAFTGRNPNSQTEEDIFYVWLKAEDNETGSRERTMEKALDKINKVRKPLGKQASEPKDGEEKKDDAPASPRGGRPPVNVAIDFDRIHERVKLISIPDSAETGLVWTNDGKKLLFGATVGGTRGTYSVEFPDDMTPKSVTTQTLTQAKALKRGNQIVGLAAGVPASVTVGAGAARPATPAASPAPAGPGGFRRGGGAGAGAAAAPEAPAAAGVTSYRFSALQEVDLPKKHAAAFDLAWRIMRDNWYDEKLGNRDWNAVRTKYIDMAAAAPDAEAFGTVVSLMLGELNGSHLGFTATDPNAGGPARRRGPAPGPAAGGDEPTGSWRETTMHLGIRFDPNFAGPGLLVKDVLPAGPADQRKSRIAPDELVVSIDGTPVNRTTDLTAILNLPPGREVTVRVRKPDSSERDVSIKPISYTAARNLIYEKWLADNRAMVEKLSNGTLGYLHVSAMSMPSFYKFEKELYAAGAGKEGLVIDVRENGGGSTADHLLTSLTQPVHAIAVPRGGDPGYPQDRKVYATWNKPIVVMCNQNSFSNAEIFSHAIKTLKRGQLVGVPTAGGVISTGGTNVMDVGFLRLPTRGWFTVNDGEDMELHGAVPDHIVWPTPGDAAKGRDAQVEKAVEVLLADVKAAKAKPQKPLIKATDRK
ncbi:MAG: S41 family peptidase [Gemmataceae bacterium]